MARDDLHPQDADALFTADQAGEISNTDGLSEFPLEAAAAVAKTFASIPTLATYLISGYWNSLGTPARHWASHTVTVNITGLNAAEKVYAQAALAAWHDVANISFTIVTGTASASIVYKDTGTGAQTTTSQPGGLLQSATVAIASTFGNGASSTLNSYSYLTYVHETGHALGLGHQGPYDSAAATGPTYADNAIFTNDTRQYSVMSYFEQYNFDNGSPAFAITPEMADIYAIQQIYGAATTRTDDSVYGFNTTAGATYDFSKYQSPPAFTIYDSGGIDTLDASGYANDQVLDLTPGNWSSIGGGRHNIGIYTTTNIENAIGGFGNDTIIGNGLDNLLKGRDGADSIDGGAGIDTAVFSGLRSAYTLTPLSGTDVRVSGPDGTDTLKNIEKLKFDDITVPWPLPPPAPDLAASNLALASVSAPVNSSTTLSYKVSNRGTSSSPSAVVGIYLSSNDIFGPADALQATRPIGPLAPGETVNDSFTYVLNTSGAYYLIAVVNPVNTIGELDESNNASNAVAVSISSIVPDLDASNFSLGTTSLVGGGSTTVSYRVDNGGGLTTAPASTVGIYRSGIAGIDTSEVLLATRPVGALAVGASFNDSFSLTLTTPGTYSIYAVADHTNAIAEKNELNNPSNGVQVTVVAPNRAPTIVSDGGGNTAQLSTPDTATVATTVKASDPDAGTVLVYSIAGGADAAAFQINASSGVLSFKSAPDFRHPADADHNNSYVVQVRASDGSLADDQTITVNVTDARQARNDFNGDGTSDLLWRHDGGNVTDWDMSSGKMVASHLVAAIGNDWRVVGTGDFNGDHTSDLLWRHDGGNVTEWDMSGSQMTASHLVAAIPNEWRVAGTGDFNGDGKSDILWRHDSGVVTAWDMDGGRMVASHLVAAIGNDWHIAGTGDFNGDGKTDILWRHDSGTVTEWDMAGGQMVASNLVAAIGNDWHIARVGDFNGDGMADLLWRHDSGNVTEWTMNNGHLVSSTLVAEIPNDWHISGTGDFNRDGKTDILWRHDSGVTTAWQMNGGQLVASSLVATIGNDWHIV